jgi:peptidoglycan/LPS O-acetylase OafA/YrhL
MIGVDERRQHERIGVRPWAWRPRDRGWLAAATQLPGTLFFNHSTFATLAHNLSASEADRHVWRPDVFGSILFLVASALAISALGAEFWRPRSRGLPWWIAWINMLGSVAFMASAIAGFVVPSTDAVLDLPVDNAGTLVGAVCFLVAATLMLPAWRNAVRSSSGHPAK